MKHWVFRNINYVFESPRAYALLGKNGSGKTTLMRILSGMQNPSEGTIVFENKGEKLEDKNIFKHITYAAPAMDLIEEMTLEEFLGFHFLHKKPLQHLTVKKIIQKTGLEKNSHTPIADLSSGMKQRVKLAQAIFSDTPLLLLDEPCTNLDDAGVAQYLDWIKQYGAGRLLIIASNDEREYGFCEHRMQLDKV